MEVFLKMILINCVFGLYFIFYILSNFKTDFI